MASGIDTVIFDMDGVIFGDSCASSVERSGRTSWNRRS